ncbi:MAG: hypothetical protein EA369_06950 [Bradymonadales bacterium]|nr:MAG: hypothetical protein EA369_06950 [Bradymonadales bacterium]
MAFVLLVALFGEAALEAVPSAPPSAGEQCRYAVTFLGWGASRVVDRLRLVSMSISRQVEVSMARLNFPQWQSHMHEFEPVYLDDPSALPIGRSQGSTSGDWATSTAWRRGSIRVAFPDRASVLLAQRSIHIRENLGPMEKFEVRLRVTRVDDLQMYLAAMRKAYSKLRNRSSRAFIGSFQFYRETGSHYSGVTNLKDVEFLRIRLPKLPESLIFYEELIAALVTEGEVSDQEFSEARLLFDIETQVIEGQDGLEQFLSQSREGFKKGIAIDWQLFPHVGIHSRHLQDYGPQGDRGARSPDSDYLNEFLRRMKGPPPNSRPLSPEESRRSRERRDQRISSGL